MQHIRNLFFFFLIFSYSYASQNQNNIDLDVLDIHKKITTPTKVFLSDGKYLALDPKTLIINRQKQITNTFEWKYSLEFDFKSPNFKLLFNNILPPENELKFWSDIAVQKHIFLNKVKNRSY